MNCPELEETLHRWLDGEALDGERAAVQDHLQTCTPCRELWGAAQHLREALRRRPIPLPPPGLANMIVARVADRRSVFDRFPSWRVAAALVVVALGIWGANWLLAPVEPAPRLAVAPPPMPKPPAAPVPSVRQQLKEAGDATLALTRHFARDTAASASVLVPPVEQLARTPLPEPVEALDFPEQFQTAGRTVAMGFEPVTTSAKRAWNMLVKELPPLDRPPPAP